MALFEILITSAIICKQRFLHENEIVQLLKNYKYEDVNHGHCRKPLQTSTNSMENDYPKTTHTFSTDHSIFSYFLHLTQNQSSYFFNKLHFSLSKETKSQIYTAME